MAKKKINSIDTDELDDALFAAPSTDIQENETPVEAVEAPAEKKVVKEPAVQAPPQAPTPVKKKRVRIRKKTAKKLSAAIICQNPNITRFI